MSALVPNTTKKRPLPRKIAAMKARKRRKLESTDQIHEAADVTAREPTKPTVRLDDLHWRKVDMPDRLDDFEGFFGLEEIEDVDVVRNGNNGRVSYRLASKAKKAEDRVAGIVSKSTASAKQEELLAGSQKREEEWSGIEDDMQDSASSIGESDRLHNEAGSTSRKGRSEGLQRDGGEQLAGFAFTSLAEEALEDGVDVSAWSQLHLSEECLSSLSKMNFTRPTPIQRAVIPEILAGHDVIGKASTGSGKTLAFGIPILEHYLDMRNGGVPKGAGGDGESRIPPVALILSPTRELAHQIADHLKCLFTRENFEGPAIATVTGGLSVQKQRRLLAKADVVIGTPGRLWEVISEGHGLIAWLQKIKFLVIDEADRVLSDGHFKEVQEILHALDQEGEGEQTSVLADRQTLVFSATFQKGLQQKLAGPSRPGSDFMDQRGSMEYLLKKLNFRQEEPKFIDVNPLTQMASGVKEAVIECAGMEKDLYLYALLLLHPNLRTLVFTNSISTVRRLTPLLANLNLPALPLHSHMPQKARLRSIERFSSQQGAILLATDVAARGLDIPGVELIVHYHLPRTADMYVHRSGRTARAENSGTSILLCAPEEVLGVRRLVAKVHATAWHECEKQQSHQLRSVDIDRRIVARLKPRATLAKTIADTVIAKEKRSSRDELFKEAAEELGVDYDSEEMDKQAPGRRRRGSGRKRKEREASTVTRGEVQSWRRQLKGLLTQRINVGMSEKYLTGSGVDVAALLEGTGNPEFIGPVHSLGLGDD